MHIITNYKDIDRVQWHQYVKNHPMGNVFYTHQMVELYARTTNYEPVVCCLINENTIKALIVGVFISEGRGFIKLRYTHYNS